jgi:peptide/nickel transport system substrate-binding protein
LKYKRLVAAGAIVAAGAMVLSGCTPPRASEIVKGTSITVAMNDKFTAWNVNLADTNSLYNAQVAYMGLDGFGYYNDKSEWVKNTDFGTYEVTSEDPWTVKYTIKDGVKWSDGTPVDAADMLMYWAAFTTHRTDGEGTADEESGELTGQTGTFWNTAPQEGVAFDNVEDVPKIGDDGRSMTVVYKKFYTDWELVSPVSVSAHGTVQLAYPGKYDGADGAKKAKADIIKAIQDKDYNFLAPVSKSFNQDYKLTEMPAKDSPKLYSNYAYTITDIKPGEYVTLTANKDFTWGPSPKFEKITVRTIPDSQAQLTALQNGEIAIASGQPTPDIANALSAGIKNVDYVGAPEASFEHIDLQVANGGPFDPATYGGDAEKAAKVREAFFKVLPRQDIINKLIVPLQADAKVMNTLLFLPGSANGDKASEVSGYGNFEQPDVAGAKALLAEVGVTTPVKVRFMFSQTNTRRQQEYQLIKPVAAEAGFDLIDSSSPDWSTLVFSAPDTYDAALFAWIQNSTGLTSSTANYITGGANNPYGWTNSDLDGIFKQLDAQKDQAKGEQQLIDAEKIMGEQYWSIPIFQFPGITAWDKSKVTGVTAMPLSPQYFWNFWEWTPVASSSK